MFRNKALWLGSEGNQKAEAGDYYGAIDLFSKAIGMCPYDYRFYLNRAFCYERLELYHFSLMDSEEAIRLNKSIEKCYIRKARALVGLKEYSKAEKTYQLILQMNADSTETTEDLIELRFRALKDMGFDKQSAIKGSQTYETIRSAIDGLLSQSVRNFNNSIEYFGTSFMGDDNEDIENKNFNNFVANNNESNISSNDLKLLITDEMVDKNKVIPSNGVHYTDNNTDKRSHTLVAADKYADKARKWAEVVAKTQTTVLKTTKAETTNAKKLDKPTNIWGYNGIRVEKVNVDNKKSIIELFAPFGKVLGVEPVTSRKNSVWIYYDNPNSPIEAIASTQSTIHQNINYCNKGQTEPLKIYFAATNDQKDLKFCRPKHPENDGGECYYWRTTTCLMENCRLTHKAVNRHIDAQIWMKDTEGKAI